MHSDYYVYILFRETGVPFYVGYGRNGRWLDHEKKAKRTSENKPALNVIRKMLKGRDDIPKIKIAEGLGFDEANALEVVWIAAIGRRPHGPLVNQTDGGGGSPGLADEVRARLSEIAKNRPPRAGWKMSEEQKAALSKAKTGVKLRAPRSAEYRQKQSKVQTGKKRKCGPRSPERVAKLAAFHTGRKRSAETRAKQSAWQVGRKLPPETRAKMSVARRNPTQQARANMRLGQLGRKHSPETIEKMRASGRKRKQKCATDGSTQLEIMF
jgi:hypothetical protein